MIRERSRVCSRSSLPRHWPVLLCLLWLGCSPSSAPDSQAAGAKALALEEPHTAEARRWALGPGWSSTGSMAAGRYHHTVTLLPNGKVLAAGSCNGSSCLASAELFDPAMGTWAATGSLSAPRAFHTATLLTNDKVLVTAGATYSDGTHFTSQVYDPATGTWSSPKGMAVARSGHTATLLPDGKVLVAGGGNDFELSSAEVYDPATGTWAAVNPMASMRTAFTLTVLPSSKVLAAGGYGAGYVTDVEVYEDTGALEAWRPVVQPSTLKVGSTVNVTGSGFRGVSEANSGTVQGSATNYWSARHHGHAYHLRHGGGGQHGHALVRWNGGGHGAGEWDGRLELHSEHCAHGGSAYGGGPGDGCSGQCERRLQCSARRHPVRRWW